MKWSYLQKASNSIKSFGAYSLCNEIEYLDEGIPFLRGQNIKDGAVIFSDCLFINEEANQLLWKSEVKPRMVLLTMSGSVGESAVALEEWRYPINSNQDIAKITTAPNLNPFYMSAFLNCQFGKLQMRRLPVGSVQQHTFIWQLEKLIVPIPSDSFQVRIEKVFRAAHEGLKQSHNFYSEAESLLLDELGLKGWQPSDENIAIKAFSESFGSAGRLDAEFYNPSDSRVVEQCKSYKLGWQTIGEIIESITNGVESRVFVETGVPYIRVGDIKTLDIDSVNAQQIPRSEAEVLISKIRLKTGDVLTVRSGSIGQAAVVKEKDLESIVSSHLIRLRLKPDSPIRSTPLALFLSTTPGVRQIMMHSNGAVVPEISQPSLTQVVIPIIQEECQNALESLIAASDHAREESKRLLDIAKRGVEVAIEQDEVAATRWLDERLKG